MDKQLEDFALALENDNEQEVQRLRSEGFDINSLGLVLLSDSAYQGNLKIVEKLLELGVDVNAQDKDGHTPLHMAAMRGNRDVVKLLLDKRARVNARDEDGYTALHMAAHEGYMEVVELLLENGADINARNRDANTALHDAAKEGKKDIVLHLLNKGAAVVANRYDQSPEDLTENQEIIEIINKAKFTRLMLKYAQQERWTEVRECIEKGADINTQDEKGNTVLHYAVDGNVKKTVQVLLDKWVKLHIVNKEGKSPIDLIKGEEVREIIKKAQSNRDLLHWAQEQQWTEVRECIEKGADVNARDKDGYTALHWAAYFGVQDEVELLLEKGADIDARTIDGQSAMDLAQDAEIKRILEQIKIAKDTLSAARRGDWDEVKSLINNDSLDINSKDNSGNTLLHYAAKQGKNDIVELLTQRGIDVNARNDQGFTAMHEIIEKSNNDFDKLQQYGEEVYQPTAAKNQEIINKLIEKGGDLVNIDIENIKDGNARKCIINSLVHNLQDAAYKGKADVIKGFSRQREVSNLVNASNEKGYTALRYALLSRNEEVIKEVLDLGAYVDESSLVGYSSTVLTPNVMRLLNSQLDKQKTDSQEHLAEEVRSAGNALSKHIAEGISESSEEERGSETNQRKTMIGRLKSLMKGEGGRGA